MMTEFSSLSKLVPLMLLLLCISWNTYCPPVAKKCDDAALMGNLISRLHEIKDKSTEVHSKYTFS